MILNTVNCNLLNKDNNNNLKIVKLKEKIILIINMTFICKN